jgi:putative ABC transport system permease protein
MIRNFSYLCRSLSRNWSFTLAVIVSLSFGMGGTSAVLILLNGLLFRPMPYANGDRVLNVWSSAKTKPQMPVSYADFVDFRRRGTSFTEMAAYSIDSRDFTTPEAPESLNGAMVTSNFFDVLQVKPLLGRTFEPQDGHQPLIVLAYSLWQRDFAGRKSILGETLLLSGKPYTVIGVMPPTFAQPEPLWGQTAEYWCILPDISNLSRGLRFLRVVGRLKPDVSPGAAAAEMRGISTQLAKEFPQTDSEKTVLLVPLRDQMFGRMYRPLFLLLFVAMAVFLIACANVANLQFARSNARAQEMSIRLALGAGMRHLVSWTFAESLLLTCLGAAGGLTIGYVSTRALRLFAPAELRGFDQAAVDARILLLSGLLAVLATFLTAMPSASRLLRAASWTRITPYREAGVRQPLQNLLLTAELALVLPLVIATLLLARSFSNLTHVDPGFDQQSLLSLRFALPQARYANPSTRSAFFQQLLAISATTPGIRSAALSSSVPLTPANAEVAVDIAFQPDPNGPSQQVNYHVISESFFQTMGISMLSGRNFTPDDNESGTRVAIINASFAKQHWTAKDDPVGKVVSLRKENRVIALAIVGVVADIHSISLALPPSPELYVPLAQDNSLEMGLILRSAVPPTDLITPIRVQVARLDKQLPVTDVYTMDKIIYDSTTTQRFALILLLISATIALALALVGVGSVVAYIVSQRTREFAIRMAVGATQQAILNSLMRHILKFSLFGLALGLLLALNVNRIPRYLIYGIRTTDLASFVGAPVGLTAAILLASYMPIRAVLRIDPATLLRSE